MEAIDARASVGGPILAPRGGIGAGEGRRRCGPGRPPKEGARRRVTAPRHLRPLLAAAAMPPMARPSP